MSGTLISRVSGWFPDLQLPKIERFVTIRNLLRTIGFVYAIAFLSFGVQAPGLSGSHGILPIADFLREVQDSLGHRAWMEVPTVFWVRSTDSAIRAVWIGGTLAGLAAIFTRWQRPALAVCFVLWLSICATGQDFLGFQWDMLLVEAGFLAIFADQSKIRIWLFRWLLFRLMFFSGIVKILSVDPNWRNLTAMHYHYETQPLPTPVAWLAYQLPMAFQKFSTAMVFASELLAPVLFFGPRPVRRLAGWTAIGLQVLILLTGNYTFFNLLTIALCLWLFLEPEPAPPSKLARAVGMSLAVLIGTLSGITSLEQLGMAPQPALELLHFTEPFRIVNSYGLFATMTTTRPEIIVEGSNDGETWLAYEFPYKPGDVRRAPPIVAPHQPRLDWQMWFAALGNYQENRWFMNFVVRLLQGEPTVLRLMRYNPFPNAPPKYIRARLYLYHFTSFGEPGWWKREERGLYFPAASLK